MAGTLEVRLLNSLTSYETEPGTPFNAVVVAPYMRDGRVVMPPGTVVLGAVLRVARVGMAMVRERATLELEFSSYQLPDGRRFPLQGKLRRVDNAKEEVTERGVIKGILAANGPQSLLGGVWHSPNVELFPRSFIGLTGASGRIFTQYAMGPIGAAGLFATRVAMFRLPEPEIQLSAGTELFIEPRMIPSDAPTFDPPSLAIVPVGLRMWLANRDTAIRHPSGAPAQDVINIALIGTREEVEQAFQQAGWSEAAPWSGRTTARAYEAYNAQASYSAAPVSKLLYGHREPDLVLQKQFNTIGKRHHVRFWRVTFLGQEVWLGAATHDIGMAFKSANMTFDHKIELNIDRERTKLFNDLTFAGCIERPGYVDRPHVETSGREGGIITDGRIAVLFLKSACEATFETPASPASRPPLTRATRMARRMMLEGRQYVLRGNAYYWGYRALAMNRQRKNRNTFVE